MLESPFLHKISSFLFLLLPSSFSYWLDERSPSLLLLQHYLVSSAHTNTTQRSLVTLSVIELPFDERSVRYDCSPITSQHQVGPTALQARRDSSFQLRSSFCWLSSCSAIAAASFLSKANFLRWLHFLSVYFWTLLCPFKGASKVRARYPGHFSDPLAPPRPSPVWSNPHS